MTDRFSSAHAGYVSEHAAIAPPLLKKKPLVSVILDNYNYAQYLPEALGSVLSQTYKNFELILVDDGSTDGSRNIIEDFVARHKDGKFAIKVILQKNGGQSSALNAGFLHCDGDIICFLDSDDVWFPQKIEKIVEAHYTHHIVHHVETVDDTSNPALFGYAAPSAPKPYSRVLTGIDWHHVLMEYGYMCHHSSCSSMSYSKEILNRIFPLLQPERMGFCTDTVIFTLCLSLAKMYKLDKVLSYYRIHGSNIYAGKYSGEQDRKLTEKIREYCHFQCDAKGLPAIPFHPYKYFHHLLSAFCVDDQNSSSELYTGQFSERFTSQPIAIYGTASAGTAFYHILRKKNVPVCCFVDSNPKQQGTVLFGLPVISPEEIRSKGVLALIASWASRDITEKLRLLDLVENQDYITFPI